MHYAHFKQRDPRVLQTLIESFPFAAVCVNGAETPASAYAPLTFRQSVGENGLVEFHLAKENPIAPLLQNGAVVTVIIHGPCAAVSPSWYTARFAGENPDRSKTAPTYHYVNAALWGRVEPMDVAALSTQIADLVTAHEPPDGWKLEEIDPATFAAWRERIIGFRMPIAGFDLTAKLGQEQHPADRPGIITGLRKRGTPHDLMMAALMEGFDGGPESLVTGLRSAGFMP